MMNGLGDALSLKIQLSSPKNRVKLEIVQALHSGKGNMDPLPADWKRRRGCCCVLGTRVLGCRDALLLLQA